MQYMIVCVCIRVSSCSHVRPPPLFFCFFCQTPLSCQIELPSFLVWGGILKFNTKALLDASLDLYRVSSMAILAPIDNLTFSFLLLPIFSISFYDDTDSRLGSSGRLICWTPRPLAGAAMKRLDDCAGGKAAAKGERSKHTSECSACCWR